MNSTLHAHQYALSIISRSVPLRMRNVSDKLVEKIKTHILCSVTFFPPRKLYEMTWKIILERGRPQMTIWRMRIEFWITKAKNTHSEYVILIAFPLQQYQILSLS